IDGVVGGHAVIGLVPAHVFAAGIGCQHDFGTPTADDAGDLLDQIARTGVFEHAVVKLQPLDVIFRNPEDAAGFFLLGFANAREAFASHVGIVRPLVVIGVNDDAD